MICQTICRRLSIWRVHLYPQLALWGVYSARSVRPSFHYTGFPSLICYSSHTTEWKWMKLSQNLNYMFPLYTFYFRFWFESIWHFHIAKHGLFLFFFFYMDKLEKLSLIHYFSYAIEWNLMKLSQNFYYMFPLCTFYFRFWSNQFECST